MQHHQVLERHARAEHMWLSNLVRELFQTEQSAKDHPILEAQRLGEVPPAEALRAVSAHARRTLIELPPLVLRHDLPVSNGGRIAGAAFSSMREHFADLLLTAEQSYRGTLLGMRHGVDLVLLIERVAREEGDVALANWCDHWLERRRPLVEGVARELSWFAANPTRAREAAKGSTLALGLQMLVHSFGQVAGRILQLLPKKA